MKSHTRTRDGRSIYMNSVLHTRLQQQRDIPRILQQMHAQQIPPGAAIAAHPGLPGLPGLGPAAPPGLPVPTSASAALLGLGLTPGAAAATPCTTAATHSLSMLGKTDIHRGQPDDLKSNGGKSAVPSDV